MTVRFMFLLHQLRGSLPSMDSLLIKPLQQLFRSMMAHAINLKA
jgi:hypothetical protein